MTKLKWLAIIALMLTTATANAAFQKTDWKAPGDALVAVDSDTGLEWLNLAATDNKSVAMVRSELATVYAGWRLPTNAEVAAMMSSIFEVPISTLEFNKVTARSPSHLNNGALRFARMMSNGAITTANHHGFYYDEDGLLRTVGTYLNDYGTYAVIAGLEHVYAYNDSSVLTSLNIGGVMLVRDQASIEPEPKPVPVMGGFGVLGALSLLWGARRRSSI